MAKNARVRKEIRLNDRARVDGAESRYCHWTVFNNFSYNWMFLCSNNVQKGHSAQGSHNEDLMVNILVNYYAKLLYLNFVNDVD